jgi:hypothetical protein
MPQHDRITAAGGGFKDSRERVVVRSSESEFDSLALCAVVMVWQLVTGPLVRDPIPEPQPSEL